MNLDASDIHASCKYPSTYAIETKGKKKVKCVFNSDSFEGDEGKINIQAHY